MELDIPGFAEEYKAFEELEGAFYVRMHNNVHGFSAQRLQEIEDEYRNLDVKMRLAFGTPG